MSRIAIVDYGMGNIMSVFNAFEHLGATPVICRIPSDFDEVERIVIPGVGAFGDAMRCLHDKGLVATLNRQALELGKPTLGICLGMQIMARMGAEGGLNIGLGWFDAEVHRIVTVPPLRIPHVGWNEITYNSDHPLFQDLPSHPDFYFVHSFAVTLAQTEYTQAWCDYGGRVTAAIGHDNIFATQFHPEKSQDYGLQFLANFLDWTP